MPLSHIADELSISVPTVTERIKKLQESGVIQGIHAVLDPKTLGLDVAALITLVSESSVHYKDVTNAANKTSEVVQCFSTTGKGSHTLLIVTRNSRTLEELLRKIQNWPGVIRTETQVILSSYKLVQNIDLLPTITDLFDMKIDKLDSDRFNERGTFSNNSTVVGGPSKQILGKMSQRTPIGMGQSCARNTSEMLDAFRCNPYTQSLHGAA